MKLRHWYSAPAYIIALLSLMSSGEPQLWWVGIAVALTIADFAGYIGGVQAGKEIFGR